MENSLQSNFMKRNINVWLDVTGATVSWLCAIHCIALPFAVSVLPLVGLSFLLDETTEQFFIGISIAIAALTLLPGFFRHHRKLRTLLLFTAGISLIVASHLIFEENLILQIPFLLIGAILVTTAHFINRRLCMDCAVCCES